MKIFGIELSKISYKELLAEITSLNSQNIVFTPNPEILLRTQTDEEFRELLNKAQFLTSDGIGLYIAFQIQDSPLNTFLKNEQNEESSLFQRILLILGNILLLPYFFFNLFFRRGHLYKTYGERICGSDLTSDVVKFAEKNNVPVTVVDLYNPTDVAKVASQEQFLEKMKGVFPNLKIHYYIYNPEKKEEIIEQIKNSDSKILFSTLGMKRQEQSVVEIMEKCYNLKIGLGIGSSFDYFIGFQKRAPKIWRALGVEWLYRLATGPQKMVRLRRLWDAIFVFLWKVLISK